MSISLCVCVCVCVLDVCVLDVCVLDVCVGVLICEGLFDIVAYCAVNCNLWKIKAVVKPWYTSYMAYNSHSFDIIL